MYFDERNQNSKDITNNLVETLLVCVMRAALPGAGRCHGNPGRAARRRCCPGRVLILARPRDESVGSN